MGMKKPSGALIALRQRKASSNPDNATTGGHGTPTCSDVNEDNISERGDDGHDNNNGNNTITPVTGKDYAAHQFWNYVDDYLVLVHTKLFKDIPDSLDRRNKIVWYDLAFYFAHTLITSPRFFNEALQIDIFNYQGGTKIPSFPVNNSLPPWQEALQRNTRYL